MKRPLIVLGLGLGLGTGCGLVWAVVRGLERTFVAVTVHGASMEPAFRDGDRVLVHRGLRPIAGRVVVVERPDGGMESPDSAVRWLSATTTRSARALLAPGHAKGWIIKRVAAAPGDSVPPDLRPALPATPHGRVPPGQVLLLGDNRDFSFDSRRIGYVPTDRVLGAVLHRLSRRAPRR